MYRFLTRTLAAVPFGAEGRRLDLDHLIDELSAESGSGTESEAE